MLSADAILCKILSIKIKLLNLQRLLCTMMKKVVNILLLVLFCSSMGIFAQESEFKTKEYQRQMRDAAALNGRQSKEYAVAMCRYGSLYADSLNMKMYDMKKAMQYMQPAVELVMNVAPESQEAVEVLTEVMATYLKSKNKEKAINYAEPLFKILRNEIETQFADFDQMDRHLYWESRTYEINILLAALNNGKMTDVHQDMLYNLCLYQKGMASHARMNGDELMPDFKQVAGVLVERELAVEFVSYFFEGKEYYMASVLRSQWKHPKKVDLCARTEIIDVIINNKSRVSKISELYDFLWDKILNHAHVRDRIYFAPCSDFYQVGIEYVRMPSRTDFYVCDAFEMHRMLSTRSLIKTRRLGNRKTTIRTAAIFGNVNYGEGTCWQPLTQTVEEVQSIEKDMTNADYKAQLFMGSDCTEKKIKQILARPMGIVHIATHGYYNYREEDPMLASGLVLAGANDDCINDSVVVTGQEGDHILSAGEIEDLNLKNTGLVVLSACRSGVGRASVDGVLGLQSALKNAGAETIVLSLWNVDDRATKILMKRFYDNMINKNMSVQKALLEAQQAVKKIDFINSQGNNVSGKLPQYWAAFICYE